MSRGNKRSPTPSIRPIHHAITRCWVICGVWTKVFEVTQATASADRLTLGSLVCTGAGDLRESWHKAVLRLARQLV